MESVANVSQGPSECPNPLLSNEAEEGREDSTVGTYLELNLEYAEAPFVAPIDEDIQPLNTDISQLQKECEDFKAIYHYLHDQILPDDEKFAKFVVCEANQYVLKDGTLYHLFQPRARNKNNDNSWRFLKSNDKKYYTGTMTAFLEGVILG